MRWILAAIVIGYLVKWLDPTGIVAWVPFAIVVVGLWVDHHRKRRDLPPALDRLACSLQARQVPARNGGLPSLQGTLDGRQFQLRFPEPFWWSGYAFSRRMELRFRTPVPGTMRIGRRRHIIGPRRPLRDLLEVGVPASTACSPVLRVVAQYLFRARDGSELVVKDGWAQMSIHWSLRPERLHPDLVGFAMRYVVEMVRAVEQAGTATPDDVNPWSGAGDPSGLERTEPDVPRGRRARRWK